MSDLFLSTFNAPRSKVIVYTILYFGLVNLAWEILQLPLYTLWSESSPAAIIFAILHCTVGDILIATLSLFAAMISSGGKRWPQEHYWRVALLTTAMGFTYTIWSEWNNTVITRAWAYSAWMPTLWGIGLSPLLQWVLIPAFTFWKVSKQLAVEHA